MIYQWAEGFHPPKGVDVEDVGEAVERAVTPAQLLRDSTEASHCLHEHYWINTTNDEWAQKGRLDDARHICGGVKRVWNIGGQTTTTRVVEFVRQKGEGQWARMQDIIQSPDLLDAHFSDIERMLLQASDKIANLRRLIKAKSSTKAAARELEPV